MRLGVAWVRSSNAQYRAFQPMKAMARRGHTVVWPSSEDGVAELERLETCDAVHVYRRSDVATLQVLADLRRRGIPFTFDNDDDFTVFPRESPNYRESGGLAGRRIFQATVKAARAADTFTTTNDVLADRYRRAGVSDVEVIGNYLVPSIVRPRRPHDGVVIGWVAGLTHRADIMRIPIVDALKRILEMHPSVRVECIGLDLGLRERYRHDGLVQFEDLPERIGGFDIGIGPLADIPFNRARSDIKLKEYAASGVPWIASPVGPYVHLGENQGGRLSADDRWVETLDGLIRDDAARRQLAHNALAWARTQTIDAVADRWEAVFRRAVTRSGRGGVVVSLPNGTRLRVRNRT